MVFCLAVLALALPGLILSAVPRTRPWMSWVLRRWFFCAAVVATLIGLFYAEENWRGQRALDRSKRELEAKGVVLDWDKFIPPAVPDDQNVFKAPKMQEWFVIADGNRAASNELTGLLRSPTNFPIWGQTWGKTRSIDTEADARAYLAWSDQLQPQFTMIRETLKRPYSRMDGDYASIMTLPIPNFIAIREMARVLAQRTHCYLLVHEPEKAVEQLALMHDLSHLMDAKPTGKPMTLVAAMINVAVVGLYAEVIGDGLQMHGWKEPQLVELQRQLSEVHVMIPVAAAFASEPAASTRALEMVPLKEIANAFGKQAEFFRFAPRGWVLQNIANEVPFFYAHGETLDAERETVSPSACREGNQRVEKFIEHRSIFKVLAAMMIPNISKAAQTTAKNQNLANQALTACALERYHLAHGEYPQSLDALTPDYLKTVPHDVINGGPLKYSASANGFLLYSIGWNETDDGGKAATLKGRPP